MSNYDYIQITPEQLLQVFQTAYYTEHGETLRIGSDEFAAASIFTYALSVLFNTLNDSAKQRFIDTATGVFLDAIAATYGISTRPDGYYATCLVDVDAADTSYVYSKGAVRLKDDSGKVFVNARDFVYSTRNGVPFKAVSTGSAYNGIPAGSLAILDGSYTGISGAVNVTATSGGVDASYYENDDNFRIWLKTEIQSYAGAGTAMAYRGRAMNASSDMVDAYVVQQGDSIFEAGKVKIYILAQDVASVLPLVYDACTDPAFRPVCDYVEVHEAQEESLIIGYILRVVYEKRFSSLASERNNRIFNEYKAFLKEHIGRPFVYAEMVERIKAVDGDGVYATDAAFIGLDGGAALPIYPQAGHVNNLNGLYFSVEYVDVY